MQSISIDQMFKILEYWVESSENMILREYNHMGTSIHLKKQIKLTI